MTPRKFIGLILLILAVAGLSACGGGGGGNDNPGIAITLTPSKAVALADGHDVVTVHASVINADGAAVADGTPITFTAVDDAGNPFVTQTTTVGGLASITLTRDPIQGANNQTGTVKADSGGASQSAQVKFINQPASADVFIAFKKEVTNLAGLDFKLNITTGATFSNPDPQPIHTMNNAAVGSTLVLGNFISADNSTRIVLANPTGFNTGTAPIIMATFAISTGLPEFTVDQTPASFTATDFNSSATVPPATAADMVVTVSYDTER
jgi:hypothetical protein